MGGPPTEFRKRHKIDKRFLSKNKTIKLYKEKQSKIEAYKKEVAEITQRYEQVEFLQLEKFADFPLTTKTKRGLWDGNFVKPTDIQKETIGLALKGHDILGAAKTGSGKTLAFVIPLLERLYVFGWSILDGLGALIITPTRELAYQIFEVLNKVGANHHFSVALVIGGKDLAKERKLLDKCNILICTPGRLLQHMDENPLFDAMNLKMLVLDEADRILDLGFQKTMNAILENLPQDRQTLLFSATQTKSVKDLARLSLKNPVYVSVHEYAKHTTPEALQQSYIVCDAHDKMNLIWSFIKSHKKQKILIFMASCKQVKFTYESFCRLRPGVSVMALYGSLHQLRRMQIYDEFCRKNHVVMFATDIASRGLDFPNVNWVVQLDCPEDVNTYIHRAGRTARYEQGGESLLVLLPSEKESMIEQLKSRKIPIEEIKVNPSKLFPIQRKMMTICARDVNLHDSCLRAYKAYLKSIFLMKDKTVFDVTKIDFEQYAKSLGLEMPPRVRFLEKKLGKGLTIKPSNKNICDDFFLNGGSDESEEEEVFKVKVKTQSDQSSDEGELEMPTESKVSKKPLTKSAIVKRLLKKKVKPNTVVKFDDDGQPIREICGKTVPIVAADLQKEFMEEGYSIEKAKLIKEKEDKIDRLLFKEKIKSKHREARLKLREKKGLNKSENAPAILKGSEDETGSAESENDVDPNNMSSSEDESDAEISSYENELDIELSSSAENELDTETSVSYNSQKRQIALDNSTSQSSDESSKNELKSSLKRKQFSPKVKIKRARIEEDERDGAIVKHGRSIEDDEQLALHFLSNT